MDKPQIVCCAVFSNQDQGIKIYWSLLLKMLSLHCVSNIIVILTEVFIKVRIENIEELKFSEFKWLSQN